MKERIIETTQGIQGAADASAFAEMQKGFRDRGILQTSAIIKQGINGGQAAELGPGPGLLGLEWLKSCPEGRLTGIEISREMIRIAETNRADYKLNDRAGYKLGTALDMPLENESVDAVFSNGSLHEWEDPYKVLEEIYRVLKPGGQFFISDLRRDLPGYRKFLMSLPLKSAHMKQGLKSSIDAAYTAGEMRCLLQWSRFPRWNVRQMGFGLILSGVKDVA